MPINGDPLDDSRLRHVAAHALVAQRASELSSSLSLHPIQHERNLELPLQTELSC